MNPLREIAAQHDAVDRFGEHNDVGLDVVGPRERHPVHLAVGAGHVAVDGGRRAAGPPDQRRPRNDGFVIIRSGYFVGTLLLMF
jgi:hypothetical protein